MGNSTKPQQRTPPNTEQAQPLRVPCVPRIVQEHGYKNVIFFGETGTGKSSAINMLIGRDVAIVDNSAIGCTFEPQSYEYKDNVLLFDTVGLNEGSIGRVSAQEACNALMRLMKKLDKNGVHLLVMVMRMGRINEAFVKNYQLFSEVMCFKEVPVILLITHCEQLANMNEWVTKNQHIFTSQCGMTLADIVCVCTFDGKAEGSDQHFIEGMKKKYSESRVKLTEAIDKHIMNKGFIYANKFNWFVIVLKRYLLWGSLPYFKELKDWLKRSFNLSEEEAIKQSNELFLQTYEDN